MGNALGVGDVMAWLWVGHLLWSLVCSLLYQIKVAWALPLASIFSELKHWARFTCPRRYLDTACS